MTNHHEPGDAAHGGGYGQYLLIWIGLLALTALTVSLAGVQLGRWVIFTALTIASIKSLLVLQVFMHLRSEDRMFRHAELAHAPRPVHHHQEGRLIQRGSASRRVAGPGGAPVLVSALSPKCSVIGNHAIPDPRRLRISRRQNLCSPPARGAAPSE